MVYADYNFYKTEYLGNSIKEEDFDRLALRASQFLDYYTMGKAKNAVGLENLKMACCAIADKYQVIENAQKAAEENFADGGSLKSESVGSYSVSYQTASEKATAAATSAESAEKSLAATARLYLVGTGLLYRGGC